MQGQSQQRRTELGDEDELGRGTVAAALGKIRDTAAVSELAMALPHEARWIREAAANALVQCIGVQHEHHLHRNQLFWAKRTDG